MRASGKRHAESASSLPRAFRAWLVGACLALVIALGWSVTRLAITSKASTAARASLSETISVHASGRGYPSVNLSDGRDVLTSYSGPAALTRALQRNEAEPLALASADFDEDGVPDLICGYAHANSSMITLMRGNVDSIYENSQGAQRRKATGEFTAAPFLSPARVFALPIEPEFLGTGDFDADGHWDVVVASRSSNALYLLPGDGTGDFGAVRQIVLPGAVSALVTGEINRRDGLEDVVVAVKGEDGAQALVFEGPEGALRAEPEVFDLHDEAAALALGQLDEEYTIDLAVAAGRELMVVHGRDRKLALSEAKRAKVPKAQLSKLALPSIIRSVTAGQFGDGNRTGLSALLEDGRVELLSVAREAITKTAELEVSQVFHLTAAGGPGATQLISARVSSSGCDDLVVVDSAGRKIHVLSKDKWTAGPRMSMSASLESEAVPVAMLTMRLNEDALTDLVVLRSGAKSPAVLITLAQAVFGVTENADGGLGSLRQAIIDANNNPGADTINFAIPASQEKVIVLQSPLPEVTEAITIDATTQPGYAGSPVVAIRRGGTGSTLAISGGNSTVRGLEICSLLGGAVAPLSDLEILGAGGNRVEANIFNGAGTTIRTAENTIGGTASGAGNKFAAHFSSLISLQLIGQGAFNNQIQGNSITERENCLVGPLFQCGTGIVIGDAPNNVVGGTAAQARNIIAGRSNEVMIGGSGAGNLVQGNFIGVDATGASATGSASGVNVTANNTTIGGTTPQARNVISGNFVDGISILGNLAQGASDTGILIQGNFIGTDVTGTKALGNGAGVTLALAKGTTVGGDVPGARNIISGNLRDGVGIGAASLNACFGSFFPPGSRSETIGNYIGTDVSGTHPLGNGEDGVQVRADAFSHLIKGNLIAFNGRNGVSVSGGESGEDAGAPALSIQILENSVFSNGGLSIDLGEDGVTPNDPRDPDEGANLKQNFPDLIRAEDDVNGTTLQGTLDSTPGETFTIEFFSNPGDPISGIQTAAIGPCFPQGQVFIGSTTVTTGPNGIAPINIILPASSPGGFINATATTLSGNTSEFSACVQLRLVNADLSVAFDAAPGSVRPGGDLSYQVTVANNGPLLATNVVLTSQVPDNTTFQRLLAPAGWTSRLPDVDKTGVITCETSALNVGTSASFTIVVRVSPGAAEGTIITSSMRVSSGITDLKPGNNSVTAATIVTLTLPPPTDGGVDLSLDLKGSPTQVFAGDDITYTLTVTNPGLTPAKDVVLKQVLAGSTVLQSRSVVSGWTGEGPTSDGAITFRSASVGSGDSVFTIVVKVKPETEAGTSIITTALVTSPSDPNDKNNSRTVTTTTVERPAGPEIQSITVTSTITVVGFGFVKPVQVFIDNIGFSDPAKVKGGTRVIQKGKLKDGRSIADAVPPGKLVMITFRNKDGGEKTVSFKN